MATRPAQGNNTNKRLVKRAVRLAKPRINGGPRASNNKRKGIFG